MHLIKTNKYLQVFIIIITALTSCNGQQTNTIKIAERDTSITPATAYSKLFLDSLKLEARFSPDIVAGLRALGHEVEMLPDFDEAVGHAGAIIRHPNGGFEGGVDPRSNGGVAGF